MAIFLVSPHNDVMAAVVPAIIFAFTVGRRRKGKSLFLFCLLCFIMKK